MAGAITDEPFTAPASQIKRAEDTREELTNYVLMPSLTETPKWTTDLKAFGVAWIFWILLVTSRPSASHIAISHKLHSCFLGVSHSLPLPTVDLLLVASFWAEVTLVQSTPLTSALKSNSHWMSNSAWHLSKFCCHFLAT